MEVQVWYKVPVAAHVDTDTGEVTQVVVIDESLKLDDDEGVTHDGYRGRVVGTVATRAREIAESAVWPAWSSGY